MLIASPATIVIPSQARPKLSDRAEQAVKAIGVAGVALYIVGLVVYNLHLARLGTTDFNLLRPRYVMIGLAFVVFLVLPSAIYIVPVLTLRWARRTAGWRTSWFGFVLLALGTAFVTPLPVQYFAVPVMQRYDAMLPLGTEHLSLWSLYVGMVTPSVLLFQTGLLLRFEWSTEAGFALLRRFQMPVVRIAGGLMLIGALSAAMPYVHTVFPNLDASGGGGQPPIVRILLSREIGRWIVSDRPGEYGDEAEVGDPEQAANPNIDVGPLLLWHETGDALLLGPLMPAGGSSPFVPVALRKSDVHAIRHLDANILFMHDMLGRPTGYSMLHDEEGEGYIYGWLAPPPPPPDSAKEALADTAIRRADSVSTSTGPADSAGIGNGP